MAVLKQKEETNVKEEAEEMADTMPMSLGDPVVMAAVGSVVYSWYQFYIRDNTHNALFVGLWAPTLFAAASYIQQKDALRKLKQGLSSF